MNCPLCEQPMQLIRYRKLTRILKNLRGEGLIERHLCNNSRCRLLSVEKLIEL